MFTGTLPMVIMIMIIMQPYVPLEYLLITTNYHCLSIKCLYSVLLSLYI